MPDEQRVTVENINDHILVVYAQSIRNALTILDNRNGIGIAFTGNEIDKLRRILNGEPMQEPVRPIVPRRLYPDYEINSD